MMKGKNFYTILLCAALMVAGTAACSDDWLSGADTSNGSSEEGQVAAVKLEGNGEVVSRSAFQAGTAYRLVMFTKGFTATDISEDSVLRYNGLATETALGTFQYLVVNDDRHINNDWFSFQSLENIDDATKTETGRRSLSFYGFTYGEENAPKLDKDAYKRTETVVGGELKDLMWGILVDQNDATAKFPCEIPFRHAFSRLEFKVSQLESETGSGKGMYNLGIESIAVTGTYQIGTVDLFTGKTTLDAENKYDEGRALPKMSVDYDLENKYIAVETPDSLGAMIVFPSAAESLSGGVGEYTIGLKITLKGKDKAEVEKLVGTGNATQLGNYYTGVYTVEQVYSSVYGGDDPTDDNGSIAASPLYLQAGSKYTLHIVLMEDEVRVVTVVPSKVEWLPGETDEKDKNDNYFSTEVVGQPIFFDNTMWMDRNLGANEADPGDNYNQTIGYYYQNNRNIPYWPYRTENYGFDGSLTWPTPEERFSTNNDLSKKFSSWSSPQYKVYPIVDKKLMEPDPNKGSWGTSSSSNLYYSLQKEVSSSGTYAFFYGNSNFSNSTLNWKNRENQPAPPGYALPTQEQFQSIFPTTVFAGNITFLQLRHIGDDWYGCVDYNNNMPLPINSDITKLRICVPFYKDGRNTTSSAEYYSKWEKLNDPGQYPLDPSYYYNSQHTPYSYIDREPDGDPSPGYCSVYIISREGNDKGSITSLSSNYKTKEWGTIYGIKKVGTTEAYRMRWKVRNADEKNEEPRLYVEVCMYSCTKDDNLTVDNFRNYDWEHPVSQMFFPLCGEVEGRNSGSGPAAGFSSYGSAVLYATDSDAALHIKITGDNPQNQYMSVVSNEIQTNAKQIRLVKTQN
ncbi:hypothetical protein [uncultured Bacteroides sp.]|uniref:fimbrillin family protein n=1 Tax=uncultured Bacteroides sp. TaxID=162156 RepID=UPI00263341DC|nr:hypothetical protein [uncultured Bacteroides sp.]